MAKFKSLLYRELRIARKQILYGFVTFFVFSCLFWMVGLSFLYGNLKNSTEDSYGMMAKQFFTGSSLVYLLTIYSIFPAFGDYGTHLSDIRSNWLRYSYGLPVTPAMRATVFWVIRLLVLLGGFLMNMFNLCMASLLFDQPFRTEALSIFAFVLVIGILISMILNIYPLSARTESELNKRNFLCFASFFVIIFILIIPVKRKAEAKLTELQMKQEEQDIPDEEMVKSVMSAMFIEPVQKVYESGKYYSVPAMLVLTAAGYFLTVKAYERRESP